MNKNPEQIVAEIVQRRLNEQLFICKTDQEKELMERLISGRMKLEYSIKQLGGDLPMYKKLIQKGSASVLTLWEASFFLNAVPEMTPLQMGVTQDEYLEIMEGYSQLIQSWNKQAAPIKEAGGREARAALQRKILTPNMRK